MTRTALKGGLVVLVLVANVRAVQAAPITTNTALPVGENEVIVREQVVWTRASRDPAGLGRKFDAVAGVSVLGFGLTSDLAIFAVLPTVYKQLKTPSARRSVSGVGDMRVFARYVIFQQDQLGQTLRIAPFAGVEMPTGRHREKDTFGLLPTGVQLGSGSWDPFGGVVVTYATTDWQLDAVVSYQANTERDGREDGDIARADLSFQYRLWPTHLSASTEAFVFGVIEANLVHEGNQRFYGAVNPNAGGTTLFLSPGLQYAAKTFIAEASVQIPVVQDLNGAALEKDFISRVSVRLNF